MTDVVNDIAVFLNAQTGDLEWLRRSSDNQGEGTLYIYDAPPSPDTIATIRRYEGQPPVKTMGNPLLIRRPRIQIEIRDLRSSLAFSKAEAIIQVLSLVEDQTINGTKYANISLVGEANEVGPDSNNRQRVTINFSAEYYD